MAYTTIFKTKPKKENKTSFCIRICNLLSGIEILSVDNNNTLCGMEMLNYLFKYSKYNNGYYDIDDLLNETNNSYGNIYDLCNQSDYNIWEDEILSNIEIIVNCFYQFSTNKYCRFWHQEESLKNIEVLFKAIRSYLLCSGYKLVEDNDRLCIIESEIAIDVDLIEDESLKSEVSSFYDYKNANDIEEKKKIMLILIGKLESRKDDIDKLLGSKIADMFSNYANNLNLRHNNISADYKKYYNKSVAELNDEDILQWYNYIFAFMINIYLSIDKLKNININDGYK